MVRKESRWSYLEPFIHTDDSIHIREASRMVAKPHATVRKHLARFEKEGILIKQFKGRLTTYKIQKKAPLIVDYVVVVEKEKLINRCAKDLVLKEITSFLHNNVHKSSVVIIFGSATKDTRHANDIDILVTEKMSEEKIKEFERKYNITMHIIPVRNLNDVSSGLKEEIKKKHLIVEGAEASVKWMLTS